MELFYSPVLFQIGLKGLLDFFWGGFFFSFECSSWLLQESYSQSKTEGGRKDAQQCANYISVLLRLDHLVYVTKTWAFVHSLTANPLFSS